MLLVSMVPALTVLALLIPATARIIVYQPHVHLRGGGAMSLTQLHQTLLVAGFDTAMYVRTIGCCHATSIRRHTSMHSHNVTTHFMHN